MEWFSRLNAPRTTNVTVHHSAACDTVAAPIVHPALPSAERESILGVPLAGRCSSLLVPGLGCVNGCRFCSTTHFFGKTYTPYLASGRAIFDNAVRIAAE